MARETGREAKRRKTAPEAVETQDLITTPEHLHTLLRFQQGKSSEVRNGIKVVKNFLTAISKKDDVHDRTRKLEILKQYCQQQLSGSRDEISFSDLLSTWSFVAESQKDPVLYAVPNLLGQLLATISNYLEFREFGLSLCHSLLRQDQIHLLMSCLGAPKSRGRLIILGLRLLTEIVTFDGGALASKVFGYRKTLLKRLDSLLEDTQQNRDEDEENRHVPTLRGEALLLLLALMKFLDNDLLAELVVGNSMYSCIRSLIHDDKQTVFNIVIAIQNIIFKGHLSKQVKSQFLNSTTLSALAQLYDYHESAKDLGEQENPQDTVRKIAHKLLVAVCTSDESVLVPHTGWYPTGTNPEFLELDNGAIKLGLDAPDYSEDHASSVSVQNKTLSKFIQNLKPGKDPLQAELLRKIFESASELVADYFTKKPSFSTAPKDEPLWRGQFAFFFSVIQLPVPSHFGWQHRLPNSPPPLSIVIESILPRPFEHNVISRCMAKNEEILTLSAARLITITLLKLDAVLDIFEFGASTSPLWDQAIWKLVELFVQRIPSLSGIVTALQRTPKEDFAIRNIILECLYTYYKVLPEIAALSKFDISPVLVDLLERLQTRDLEPGLKNTLTSSLLSSLKIADQCRATQWWHKSDSISISLFMSSLIFCSSTEKPQTRKAVKLVLQSTLSIKGLLQSEGQSLDALIISLQSLPDWTPAVATVAFVDDCIIRITQKPVRYLDMLLRAQSVSDSNPLSLLACCVVDQWPFFLAKADLRAVENALVWIFRFYHALEAAGGNATILDQFYCEITNSKPSTIMFAMERAMKFVQNNPVALRTGESEEPFSNDAKPESNAKNQPETITINLQELFGHPTESPDSLQGLDRWDIQDLEMDIQSGRLNKLLQCLSSRAEDTRRQCFHTLQSLGHSFESSTHPEKQQISLLLGEICETTKHLGFNSPLPSIIPETATTILNIITDPSDKMYGKANRFLLRGPIWEVHGLIPYWISKILLSEPETDDSREVEVERLFKILVNGLRSPADMEVYRRSNVFERILSLYSSPCCSKQTKQAILQIVYRAIQAEGSDTLITRVGILAWLSIVKDDEDRDIVTQLERALSENCTEEVIERWKKKRPAERLLDH